ncbi:hypothetical protein EZS27_031764 [termite gut metagenome]|uniref:CD-NTase associated protein 4-like DNA endonuclease domain-containing protein n=1 Tax=termite gut metagenome TaxID=433724 RepID=A0A5J4QAS2_9ZZZZ
MAERAATATIAGYIYQFDYTIKCLLDLPNDNDSVDIENIEDIDIHSCTEDTAIQCKYYEATEYNHSIIAEPIRLMLNHFLNVKNGTVQSIDYKLYGFYKSGQQKLTLPIALEFLKKHFLTYTRTENKIKVEHKHHVELGLDDADLTKFLSRLTINVNAEQDSTQFQNIISRLKLIFNCDDFEAEHYYYNNALKIVSHAAKKNDANQRRIRKCDFLNQINKKEVLFNKWFIHFRGEQKYFSELRKKYFSSVNANERFFLIELETDYSKADLKELLLEISRKWTKISKRESNPFCPYIYFHNIKDEELIELKTALSREDNFIFIDGYNFKGADFSVESIIKKPNINNPIRLKLIDTLDNLKLVLQKKNKDIYQFNFSAPYFEVDNQYIQNIKIQIRELKSIKEII